MADSILDTLPGNRNETSDPVLRAGIKSSQERLQKIGESTDPKPKPEVKPNEKSPTNIPLPS